MKPKSPAKSEKTTEPGGIASLSLEASSSSRFSNLINANYETGSFSDCAFTAGEGEKVFRLHKFMIAPSSSVLRAMLASGFKEATTSQPIVLQEVNTDVLEAAFGFVYGKAWEHRGVDFSLRLWEFGHRYGIGFLEETAAAEAVKFASNVTCFSILAQASVLGNKSVAAKMHQFIADTLILTRSSADVVRLAFDDLKAVVTEVLVSKRGMLSRRNHREGQCTWKDFGYSPFGDFTCTYDHDQLRCLELMRRWVGKDEERSKQVGPLVDMLDLRDVPIDDIHVMCAVATHGSDNVFSIHAARLLGKVVLRVGNPGCQSCKSVPKASIPSLAASPGNLSFAGGRGGSSSAFAAAGGSSSASGSGLSSFQGLGSAPATTSPFAVSSSPSIVMASSVFGPHLSHTGSAPQSATADSTASLAVTPPSPSPSPTTTAFPGRS